MKYRTVRFLLPVALAACGVAVPTQPTFARATTTVSQTVLYPEVRQTLTDGGEAPGSAAEAKRLAANAPEGKTFPNASKATLLDLSDITLNKDGSYKNVTRLTTKIFTDHARDSVGEVRIPYTVGQETVRVLWARTIRADGTTINVKPDEIHDISYGDGDMYVDARLKAFSMPALEAGAIVDYAYVLENKAPYIPGGFWTGWYFGGIEPRMLSRFTITAPKSMILKETPHNIKSGSMTRLQKDQTDGTVLYTYAMKKIDPLQVEPLMPPSGRVLPQLQVSTLKDWQEVSGLYYRLAKDRMTADDAIKHEVAALTQGKATPEEKAKAIYYYVEEKTRYVAKELGIGAIQPRPAAQTCDYRYGDCKDMATLLVAMLREAGIKAYPVLLNAGSRETVHDKLPGVEAFNHAICVAEINGKEYWLDATAQVCPWGQIPGGDRGADAFVIRDGVGTFETIPPYAPDDNRQTLDAKLALKADGSASGTVTINSNGDNNMGIRAAFMSLPTDKQKQLIENIARGIAPNPRIGEFHVSDYSNKDVPVSLSFDVTFPAWAKKSGDLLVFAASPEQNAGRNSSPFGQDTVRILPITQEVPQRGDSSLDLTLPSGYAVLAPPSEADIKSDLGRYQRMVSVSGNRLTIKINGTDYRASVAANRYGEMQTYFDNYLRATEESVIVKKR